MVQASALTRPAYAGQPDRLALALLARITVNPGWQLWLVDGRIVEQPEGVGGLGHCQARLERAAVGEELGEEAHARKALLSALFGGLLLQPV